MHPGSISRGPQGATGRRVQDVGVEGLGVHGVLPLGKEGGVGLMGLGFESAGVSLVRAMRCRAVSSNQQFANDTQSSQDPQRQRLTENLYVL